MIEWSLLISCRMKHQIDILNRILVQRRPILQPYATSNQHYPLVNVYITMDNHHFIAGHIHYFDWAIFNSFLYVYQAGYIHWAEGSGGHLGSTRVARCLRWLRWLPRASGEGRWSWPSSIDLVR